MDAEASLATTTESTSEPRRSGTTRATRRCGACGALNREDAQWCGQCLVPFPARPPADPPDVGPERDRARDAGPIVVSDQGIAWRCGRCETVNALEQRNCAACGAHFGARLQRNEGRPARDPRSVIVMSCAFPGAGHAYLGLWGQALARGVTGLWTLAMVIMSVAVSSALLACLFGAATLTLWVISGNDAYREAVAQPHAVLLTTRTLAIAFAVLLGVSFLGVFWAALPTAGP